MSCINLFESCSYLMPTFDINNFPDLELKRCYPEAHRPVYYVVGKPVVDH